MSTPPKVTEQELGMCLSRIVSRRVKEEDPDRWALPDETENPTNAQVSEVLSYLQTHTRVPLWVVEADVSDALTLLNHLWWEHRRRELAWLQAGRRRGVPLAQLGGLLGIGKVGVLDRIDRLQALLSYDRPNEKITRGERRQARALQQAHDPESAWVAEHTAELAAIADGFTAAADRFGLDDEHREWVDELAILARDEDWSPGAVTVLSLAADELRTAPAIVELTGGRPYRVHEWITRADKLRTDFAALGTRGHTAGGTGGSG
jgi:hypothetical protein